MLVKSLLLLFIFYVKANDEIDHSLNTYIINRLEFNKNNKTHSNCNTIFSFKYDSSIKLSHIYFNDDETSNEYTKYKQLIAVKNSNELILLVFDDLSENGKDVLFTEYSIKVFFSILIYFCLNSLVIEYNFK